MYTVTRQRYFPDGDPVVEIALGGIDHSGPDCLSVIGEFTDPREAVEAAWASFCDWRETEPEAIISCGDTWGGSLPLLDNESWDQLSAWAESEFESLPKCERCGEIISEGKEFRIWEEWAAFGEDAATFCSESCADNAREDREREEEV